MKYHEKELAELQSMRQYCEDVQEKEDVRVKLELEENYQRKLREKKEVNSLIGHVKLPLAKNG